MTHTYPSDLVNELRKAWLASRRTYEARQRPTLPSDDELRTLLDVVYHTSLLREEGRKLEFRIIVCPKGFASEQSKSARRQERLAVFGGPRALSVAELRRLAPAAESIRSAICVHLDEAGNWAVWGILDTGSNWWEFVRHETSGGRPPPHHLSISSRHPGEMVISSASEILLALRNGRLHVPQADIFRTGAVSEYLASARKSLYDQTIERLGASKYDPKGQDDGWPGRFYAFCLSRILTCIKDKQHGGTVLLVPDYLASNDSRLTDRAVVKHECTYDYAWPAMVTHLELHRKYYDLHFKLWDSKKPIPADRYQEVSVLEGQMDATNEELTDCIRFIASLASVDGALVMTPRLRVLGFGAEVIAQSPSLKLIQVVGGESAATSNEVSIDGFGTRHRSAFRFCSSYEDAVAFVVSQDGGVKAVKRVGANVVMWPDIDSDAF